MSGTALILGPTGRFGRNAHAAFAEAGWTLRLFDRARDDLWDAAWGADVIVHGWNPAYPDWAAQMPGQTEQVIKVASATGATVLIPGNVYPFGAEADELFGPQTPHGAQNPLGRLRIEMEAAFRDGDVQTIILRGGDFIDTEASGNWFDRVITKGVARGRMTYPGALDADHAWAFLPDFARALAELAGKRGALPQFSDIAFPGYTLTGRELHREVEAATGRALRLSQMRWWPIQMLASVWPLAKHLIEMRYLWSKPHRMDGRAFDAALPGFEHTPVAEALALGVQLDIDPDKPVARGGLHLRKGRPAV